MVQVGLQDDNSSMEDAKISIDYIPYAHFRESEPQYSAYSIYRKHNTDRINWESRERSDIERLTAEMRKLKLLSLQSLAKIPRYLQ